MTLDFDLVKDSDEFGCRHVFTKNFMWLIKAYKSSYDNGDEENIILTRLMQSYH